MEQHEVVSHQEWLEARKALLIKEKAFTHARDEIARERRALPWEAVTKRYVFEGGAGSRSLADLFEGRSQLAVYHFMFAPDWGEGCPHCSFWADNLDPNVVHLAARDVTLVVVSRAPYAKLAAYRERMGWSFPWFSSHGSDFNYDFGVSFTPELIEAGAQYNFQPAGGDSDREGFSVFFKDPAGGIFRTYSTYARGIDIFNTAYNVLDCVPRGRDEDGREPQFWVRRHDEYGR